MDVCSIFSRHPSWLPSFLKDSPKDLDHLRDYDVGTVQKLLQESRLFDLWDHFLRGQARLMFSNHDKEWFSQKKWWNSANNVLEIGSGNGSYLSLISEAFPNKKLEGVDFNSKYVDQATAEYAHQGISFRLGNAEEELPAHQGRFDVVFFRFTLQWLKHPERALELAHRYLKPGGILLIIDSYDPAAHSSRVIDSLENSVRQLHERTRETAKGNRRISMEILTKLQEGTSPLSRLYRVHHTSLDGNGNRLERGLCFESQDELERYLNQNLLFFGILEKQYGISVDLPTARREIQSYIDEKGFQTAPGVHYLVLEKI